MRQGTDRPPNRPGAAVATAVIVVTALLCAWPLIGRGGWRTYMDNPCHLAVLHDLVRGHGGWSDAAFLGFPAEEIHSPLWYELLGRLAVWGAPPGVLVILLDLLGFLAPPLAVLAVARRRAPLWAATAAAWLVLVQRPWLEGYESPLAGMGAFGIAAGCLVLIVGELAGSDASPRRLALLGSLFGLLGLSHLFLILPAVVAFAIASAPRLRDAAGRRLTLARLGAAALGALASAPFWLPALRDLGHLAIPDLPPRPLMGLLYLLLPLSPHGLPSGSLVWERELAFTDVLPAALLLGLGLWGSRRARDDPAARLGLLLAATLAVLALVVVPLAGRPLLGPHTWRRLVLIRLMLALAAAPALASFAAAAAWAKRPRALAAAAVLLAISGLWWQRPLRLATPPPGSPEISQLEEVWRWLAASHPSGAGRIYVQDTFALSGQEQDLFSSHLPALTARETGWDQVGAFYGGMPLATQAWTDAEFGQICGHSLLNDADLQRAREKFAAAGVTRILLSNPLLAWHLDASGLFRAALQRGPFTVLDPVASDPAGAGDPWTEPGPGVAARMLAREPGLWRLRVESARPGGRLLLSLAWARGWRVAGAAGAAIRRADDGRLELTGLPAGRADLELAFRPGRGAWLAAAAAWAALAALGLSPIRRKR